MPHLTISRTIYDPATRDFVFDSAESKALPNIRQWINNKNPVIYWYVLRVDNQSELQLDQWAIELYTHQALNITDAYIDGIDRRFELKKREHDSWSDKYVLSIPKQLGIPIVGKGTRRVFFKVDINCKEGLMHEYGISGRFIAHGVEPVDISEKAFQYSCKVGEFKQIFDNNPDEASVYAEKRLSTRYSSNDIQLFTNSFRMIHDLYRYCHSGPVQKDELMHKLHLLYANFEMVPDIAEDKINPLLYDGIRELELIRNIDTFKPRYILLCDSLVELLHIEVMGADSHKRAIAAQESEILSNGTSYVSGDENISRQDSHTAGVGNKECPVCGNIIDPSNKSLLCKCGARFCQTCESWFREPCKPGERPLCEACFTAEQERLARENEEKACLKATEENERIRRTEEGRRRREDTERKRQEEERLRKEREETAKKAAASIRNSIGREFVLIRDGEVQTAASIRNSIGMEFVLIHAGEFHMGSNENSYEEPVHKVKISRPFYLSKYLVTQKEWKAVMATDPSYFKGDNNPVENFSWNDVQEFVKKLNAKEGTNKYRLPSEAEWEYACRAGTTTSYSFGDSESKLRDYAWYDNNSGGNTHPVGQKKPNPWGLYDMYGNVLEWCQDKYHANYKDAPTDGSVWEDGSGSSRISRGGSWFDIAGYCRSANRLSCDPDGSSIFLGFRLLRAV